MSKLIIAFFCVAVLAMSCSQPSTLYSSETLQEGSFSKYKTYAFIPTTDTQYAKMMNRAAFVPALRGEAISLLNAKGMKLDTLNPDCLFTYRLVLNRDYDVNQQQNIAYNAQVYNVSNVPMYEYGSGAVSGSSVMRGGTAPGSDVYYFSSNNRPYTYNGKVNIDTLRQGSMVIDMIDAKTKAVIWRSVAEGTTRESEARNPADAVKTHLPKMMKKLPRK